VRERDNNKKYIGEYKRIEKEGDTDNVQVTGKGKRREKKGKLE
jgi:hypothetical protein